MTRVALALSLTALVTCLPACAVAGMAPAAGAATLELRTAIADRALLAAVGPYTAADVHHVALALRLDGAAEAFRTGELTAPVATRTVVFGSLRSNTRYHVAARAFRTAGDAAPISEVVEVEMAFGAADHYRLGAITLPLADRAFDARPAKTGITVFEGGFLPADHTP